MKHILSILTCVYLFTLCMCTGKIAGTETTNGDEVTVTAGVNGITGTAPAGNGIHIYSDGYYPFNDSGFTLSTIVRDDGTFQFLNLESGNYNILCTYTTGNSSVFIQHIGIPLNRSNSDTVPFTITGSIKGKLVDSLNKPLNSAYAYIKGSPFCATTNNLGEYVLARIPDGMYTVTFKRTDTNSTWIKGPPVSISVNVYAGNATEVESVTYK